MKLPSYKTARELQSARAREGYTSIRITKATRRRLRELERRYTPAMLETILNAMIDALELERKPSEVSNNPVYPDPAQLDLHAVSAKKGQ